MPAKLRKLRTDAALSQHELAKLAGLAYSTVNKLENRREQPRPKTVRDLLRHLRTTYAGVEAFATERDRLWDSLALAEVLLLDDLGSERRTDWATETLGELVALRHREKLRTIVTSNLSLVELADHLDVRTASRIKERALVLDCSDLPDLRNARDAARSDLDGYFAEPANYAHVADVQEPPR